MVNSGTPAPPLDECLLQNGDTWVQVSSVCLCRQLPFQDRSVTVKPGQLQA